MTRQMADDEVLRVLDHYAANVFLPNAGCDGVDLAEARAAVAALQAERDALWVEVPAVYQWSDGLRWYDISRDEYEQIHASPGNFVKGDEVIYPYMTRRLYTAPPSTEANRHELGKWVVRMLSEQNIRSAAISRAERAESALEALRGQVAGLLKLASRHEGHDPQLRDALLAIKERMG